MRRSLVVSRKVTTLVVVAAGALLLACGDEAGGPSGAKHDGGVNPACAGGTTCGGDIAGNWNITSLCSVTGVAGLTDSCPEVQIDASGLTVAGSANFMSDMTYTFSATLTGTVTGSFPTACLTTATSTLTCDDLTALLELFTDEYPALSGRCTTASDGCNCTIQASSFSTSGSGTYTTAGSTLTATPTGVAASTLSYCAGPPNLTLTSTISGGSGGVLGGVAGTIVLTKE